MCETRYRLLHTFAKKKRNMKFGPVLKAAAGFGVAVGGGYGLYGLYGTPDNKRVIDPVHIGSADGSQKHASISLPKDLKISRKVDGPTSSLGVEFILFQYQSCPFCCKVRAFLEYYGLPFSVVEVNPVLRSETKFTSYRKVPILLVKDSQGQYHQLNDSSAIISMLTTYLLEPSKSIVTNVIPMYQSITYADETTKKEVTQIMNRYFVIYGDKPLTDQQYAELNDERHWRMWVDDHLVHIISPNIYRSVHESRETFEQFSINGHWEDIFSATQRKVIIYVGAFAMYFIGKKLKTKYELKDDVRESLYDALNVWMRALNGRTFMGGKLPNLADISVYGVLNSFEGCRAFKDMEKQTGIGRWYNDVKHHIHQHSASSLVPNASKQK